MKSNSPLRNRIQKNLAKLKSWIKDNEIQAYRLYEKDIPEYPYIIDIYQNNAVIYEKGKRLESTSEHIQLRNKHIGETFQALTDVFQIPENQIFLKQRKVQKGSEQYTHLSREGQIFLIKENGLNFEVNLSDYLDTGLFLDHRPFRKQLATSSKSGKFLNLFSYTSSVSVCAAKAGYQTTSVDMSKTYIDWSKRNFSHNDLPLEEHHFINQNALEFLKTNREKYDLIFLDPPSFSNSKKMEETFDVIRDQVELIDLTMMSLNENGILYFSNNAKKFQIDSLILKKYQVEDITRKSIPIDFRDKKIHSFFKITHRRCNG